MIFLLAASVRVTLSREVMQSCAHVIDIGFSWPENCYGDHCSCGTRFESGLQVCFGIVLDATGVLCMAWLFLSTSFGFRSQEVRTSALLVSAKSFGSRLKKQFGKLAAV